MKTITYLFLIQQIYIFKNIILAYEYNEYNELNDMSSIEKLLRNKNEMK